MRIRIGRLSRSTWAAWRPRLRAWRGGALRCGFGRVTMLQQFLPRVSEQRRGAFVDLEQDHLFAVRQPDNSRFTHAFKCSKRHADEDSESFRLATEMRGLEVPTHAEGERHGFARLGNAPLLEHAQLGR